MIATDIRVYAALANGRVSRQQLNSGVVQNVFPHVTSAQRQAGLETYRKTYWQLVNTDNFALVDPYSYHDRETLSPDDYAVMWLSAGRTESSEAALAAEAAGADLYGTGYLSAAAAADDMTIEVTVKNAALLPGAAHDIFRAGGKIKICSHSTAIAGDGLEEIRTIDGQPTAAGLVVTITLTEALTGSYAADGVSRVSSLLVPGVDVAPSVGPVAVVSAATGTFDADTHPIELDNIGTPEEDITLLFTDATHFTASGDTLGNIGSGDIGSDFAPVDAAVNRPMFTISSGAWGGVYQAGDEVRFTVHPAALPIGQLRVVPPGSASLANNKLIKVVVGEAGG